LDGWKIKCDDNELQYTTNFEKFSDEMEDLKEGKS
jgi:hypothetical protein